MIDLKVAIDRYKTYTNLKLYYIKRNLEIDKLPSDIGIKQQHGLNMMEAVRETTLKSGLFNESYADSASMEGCFHDIGRFEQYEKSGTLLDKESEKFTGFCDHGAYGRYLLLKNNKRLLRYFILDKTRYDRVLTEVVGEHTNTKNKNYSYDIKNLANQFQNYSFEEIIRSKNYQILDKLISLKLKLLQEVDSTEILQNIITKSWKPDIDPNKKYFVNDYVWDDFINFRYIDMNKLKELGHWTCNSGFLLRYGLLTNKVNLVGTLKHFKENDLFSKLWSVTQKNSNEMYNTDIVDPYIAPAQKFIEVAVDNLILSSKDGIIITDEDRKEAQRETVKQLGLK